MLAFYNAQPLPALPSPFIVHIYLSGQSKERQNAWLVFKNTEVELCIIDHDFCVDVQIEASTRNLTKLYMGWSNFADAIKKIRLFFGGLNSTQTWLINGLEEAGWQP